MGADEATRLGARPGWAGEQTAATLAERLGRGSRPPPQGRGVGNHGSASPPLSPPLPPPACGPRGRRPYNPPEAKGTSSLPLKGPRRPGGGRS